MAKKNPFDTPPPMPTFRPDAKLDNADWIKHGATDVDAEGKPVTPVVKKQ